MLEVITFFFSFDKKVYKLFVICIYSNTIRKLDKMKTKLNRRTGEGTCTLGSAVRNLSGCKDID